MATRANIAIQNPNGTYDCIYTHWDGADHLPTLTQNYNSEEKARELVELGDISVLGPRVKPEKGETHSYDQPAEGVTVAYGRDRNEEDVDTSRGLTLNDCHQNSYLYHWTDGKWHRI